MLDTFRKQSKSIIIYVFFGIIIAVFVINFGPQSQGCTTSESFAARINGHTLSDNDFRYGLVFSGAMNMPPAEARIRRVRESVMDRLIERDLFATEAERMGLRVSDQEVHDLIAQGAVIALGQRTEIFKGWFFNKDDVFDYERFKNTLRTQFGLTPKHFLKHQERELLAEKFRDLVRHAARISEEETRDDYTVRQLQVDLEYVRFAARKFASEAVVSAAELDAYLAKNREKVKERFHSRNFLYTKLPREVRARYLRITPPAKPLAAGKLKARAEALAARARAGEDFAALAQSESADVATRMRGGDLGWQRRGSLGLGDDVEKALFDAKPGQVIGPIENESTFHLFRVERFREGDQTLEAVERDIAEELIREEQGTELARKKAQEFLAQLAAGETWEEMFPEAPEDDASAAGAAGDDENLLKLPDPKPAVPAVPVGPYVRRATRPFARRGEVVPGIGVSPELMRDAFRLNNEHPLAEHPYEVAGNVYLVRLKKRQDVDMAEFEARKAEVMQELVAKKAGEVLSEISVALCKEAKKSVNPALVSYDDEETTYEPCSMLGAK